MNQIQEVLISSILPDPKQPRIEFDETKIKQLAESIQQHGLLHPILVRPITDGKYQIIQGERRFRACKQIGMKTIKAGIIKEDLNDKQILEIQLIENLQREDLNPLEEAETFQRMISEFNYTHNGIANRIGKSREYVTNKLRLLSLSNDLQRGVVRGNLSEGHARALLSLNDIQKQRQVCREISEKKLNVSEQTLSLLSDLAESSKMTVEKLCSKIVEGGVIEWQK